jgi:gamma-glutamyl hercynylcysteine S-oxide synthase
VIGLAAPKKVLLVWEKILKSASITSVRQSIIRTLKQTRQYTLDLLTEVDESCFFQQAHPEFSPIGWHFGHIAYTEAYWILEYLAQVSPSFSEYHRLFAADGLPKSERQNLPSIATIKDYLQSVRSKTLAYLATAPIDKQERLWRWLIQHESQHVETISFIWQLHQQRNYPSLIINSSSFNCANKTIDWVEEMLEIPAGSFSMGNDAIEAQDNERPAHQVDLATYKIDRYPVTCGQYLQFMASGGYQKRQYWSDTGWRWLEQYPVSQPLYWSDSNDWVDHPVCGVSYYEAEAYAKFAGKRLPTEAEWEKAALGISQPGNCAESSIRHTTPVNTYPHRSQYGCQDLLGNVWEWTNSWFDGYPGFSSYPYPGYSEVYFDHQHRVLRGGSWATNRAALRTSFRNWYHPGVRQILAGFRCAKSEE